jgi:hypothetical protein
MCQIVEGRMQPKTDQITDVTLEGHLVLELVHKPVSKTAVHIDVVATPMAIGDDCRMLPGAGYLSVSES